MFGIRILIYLLGIGLVIWILLRLARKPRLDDKAGKKMDDMVRCARCDTFIPRKEAIRDDGRYYCCSEHRDADR